MTYSFMATQIAADGFNAGAFKAEANTELCHIEPQPMTLSAQPLDLRGAYSSPPHCAKRSYIDESRTVTSPSPRYAGSQLGGTGESEDFALRMGLKKGVGSGLTF